MKNHKLLVVDDEPVNLKLLQAILHDAYTMVFAKNGADALLRAGENPDLILLDIMMPEMDGYEVCRRLKAAEETRNIPVIFITAMDADDDETRGFEMGAVDYITKPIKAAKVRARVRTHLELKDARQKLENQNVILEEKVREKTRELRETQLETIQRLGIAAEYKDQDTGLHIKRMSYMCEEIARAAGFDRNRAELILFASPMHDVGKIGIPDRILLKPDRLDPGEWEIMKTHPSIGAKILSRSRSKLLRVAQRIAVSHHEKWDGSGYPQGLSGEKIPIEGRIAAVADVFDALTSRRPYKEPWTVEAAVETLKAERGGHFDPDLVDAFVDVLPGILAIRERFME